MSADLFNRLLDAAGDSDKVELEMAHNGRVMAMDAYNKSPGKLTRDDFDAARQLYEETISRLSAHYLQEDVKAQEGERFKNRKQALDWLKNQGYKISQGKFYKDCDAGFPVIHQDGSVSRFHILQYGQQIDVSSRSSSLDSVRIDELKEKKLKAEVDKLEREKRKEDDRWMLVDDAWSAIGAVLGSLQESFRHHFNVNKSHLVLLAGGDQASEPEIFEACENILGKVFNEVCAQDKIEGIFEEDNGENDE